MKLYSFDLSPYAARVRISIYAKKLPIEIVGPPTGGIKSPEYLAMNPIGKAPLLVLDDGVSIPESETIVDYLEEAFPEPALLPHGPEARARVRLIARVAEVYVNAPVYQLLAQIDAPGGPDPASVEAILKRLDDGIGYLEHFMGDGPYAAGDKFTLADGEVTPVGFYVNLALSEAGRLDLMARHERLAAYMTDAKRDPVLAKVLGEMAEGLKAFKDSAR